MKKVSLIILVGILGLITSPLPAAEKAERPNVLYIMSDDHAAHAIGAYGGRLAKINPTPNLDKFAKEGIVLTNYYCTNSICTPCRAAVMTGQYNHVNGAYDLGGNLPPERHMMAMEFRKAGYQTAMIGKWHLKMEPNFDYYKVLPGQGSYHNPEFYVSGGEKWKTTVKMEGHSSDCIAKSGIEWLEHRDAKKPFFLMLHFKAPHDMFDYAKRYEDYLADVAIPEPESLWKQPQFGSIATLGNNRELVNHIGTSVSPRNLRRNYAKNWGGKEGSFEEKTRRSYNTYLKKYLRCVKGIDDNLAKVFAFLKKKGLYDNTLIVYTSDQGMMLGEHDYQDKRWMYDESSRTPFIVRYPKAIKAGSRTDAIVENVDVAPTLLNFAGIKIPESVQGKSFLSLLETGKEPKDWKQEAYYRYWMHLAHHDNPGHLGIRTKDYILIYYYGCNYQGESQTPPGWELYDLKKDPHQVVNVYGNPEYADVVKDLKERLAKLRKKIGDTGEDFPECEKVVQEFWDYDAADLEKAKQISAEWLRHKSSGGGNKSTRTKKTKDRYIMPTEPEKAKKVPLQKLGQMTEISRDAQYKIVPPGSKSFNVDNAHLFTGTKPQVKGHAFHTDIDVKEPHILIRFPEKRTVAAATIVNRTSGLAERAKGLTLWSSEDGKTWKEVWQAPQVEKKWTIRLEKPVTTQYFKLGLPGTGTLHLNQVKFFGK